MTALGLILLGIGGTDAIRATAGRMAIVYGIALWAVLLAAAALGGAAPWWLLPLPAAAGALWAAALQVRDRGNHPGTAGSSGGSRSTGGGRGAGRAAPAALGPHTRALLLMLAVGLAISTAVLAHTSAPGGGAAAHWALGPLPGDAAIIAVGLLAFLTTSSNALVRATLRRDTAPPGGDLRVLTVPQLKGGRWIGPLERIALAGLLLAGAYPVAAGVIAAKGIVRFPEIQKDTEDGNRAEYFLVGSLVSWTLSLAAAGLMWLALQ